MILNRKSVEGSNINLTNLSNMGNLSLIDGIMGGSVINQENIDKQFPLGKISHRKYRYESGNRHLFPNQAIGEGFDLTSKPTDKTVVSRGSKLDKTQVTPSASFFGNFNIYSKNGRNTQISSPNKTSYAKVKPLNLDKLCNKNDMKKF
jgi:hypothetical protein